MSKETAVTEYSELPWYRKWLNVAIIWILIMPVGVILVWSGKVYTSKKNEDGELIPISTLHKIALTVVMFVFLIRAFV